MNVRTCFALNRVTQASDIKCHHIKYVCQTEVYVTMNQQEKKKKVRKRREREIKK